MDAPRLRVPTAKQHRRIVSVVVNETSRLLLRDRDSRTAVMAGGTWRPNLQSFAARRLLARHVSFLTSEDCGRTYRVTLEADGKGLGSCVFNERGGHFGRHGCSGRQCGTSPERGLDLRSQRKALGVLEIPERPGSLAFGGPDRRTLYIAARTSLYSIRTKSAGR
jgi:hypothetical protein